jgi:DNA-binding CsgD family transcriptional regulator
MVHQFVGRRLELAMLHARLDEASGGSPRVVQIEGAPGIGKTALVEQLVQEARGAQLLRASGDEGETLLPLGVVGQLARSAGSDGKVLLDAAPEASERVENHVAVGALLLDLLGVVQLRGPLIVWLDDAHWADLPSLRALIFSLRRLVADQVLALITVRRESVPELPSSLRRIITGHRGSTLRLEGLATEDLRGLAEAMGIGGFSWAAARRLHGCTEGNPLYARAVLEESPPDHWHGSAETLPAPSSFRHLVVARYTGCAAEARDLVDAAAILGSRCPLATAGRLAHLAEPLPALDEASKADLLHLVDPAQPRVVSFPHPLVQAAVYDSLTAVRRAELHGAAAAVLGDEVAVLRHRVAAATSEDASLARDLTEFAERQLAREAWTSAAAHLVMASRVSPDVAEQQRLLLRAVDVMAVNGDDVRAAGFAAEIGQFPSGALRDSVLGYLAIARRDAVAAERLLARAWDSCDPDRDRELAATIAMQNTVHWHGRLHGENIVRWSRRAIALAEQKSFTRRRAESQCALGLAYSGEPAEASAMIDKLSESLDESFDWVQPRSARGALRLIEDDLAGARSDLESVAVAASNLGILNTAAFSYAHLARADYLAGLWDRAVLDAERAMAISPDAGYGLTYALACWAGCLVPAARGDWTTADALAQKAISRSEGYERAVVAGALAQAHVASVRGDARAALDALETVRRINPRNSVDEPGIWPWQGVYAEALVDVGRVEEADEFLVPHEALAAARNRRSMIAALARARGRVETAAGRRDRAEAAFARGQAAIGQVYVPVEHALLDLAHGEFLRRTGQTAVAAAMLTAAENRFRILGAAPYLSRCAQELSLCRPLSPRRRERRRVSLTSQEQVVARLAASGARNREVAAELVVSVKTVEFHLRNVYQKLGVTSRKELADRLGDTAGR